MGSPPLSPKLAAGGSLRSPSPAAAGILPLLLQPPPPPSWAAKRGAASSPSRLQASKPHGGAELLWRRRTGACLCPPRFSLQHPPANVTSTRESTWGPDGASVTAEAARFLRAMMPCKGQEASSEDPASLGRNLARSPRRERDSRPAKASGNAATLGAAHHVEEGARASSRRSIVSRLPGSQLAAFSSLNLSITFLLPLVPCLAVSWCCWLRLLFPLYCGEGSGKGGGGLFRLNLQ